MEISWKVKVYMYISGVGEKVISLTKKGMPYSHETFMFIHIYRQKFNTLGTLFLKSLTLEYVECVVQSHIYIGVLVYSMSVIKFCPLCQGFR